MKYSVGVAGTARMEVEFVAKSAGGSIYSITGVLAQILGTTRRSKGQLANLSILVIEETGKNLIVSRKLPGQPFILAREDPPGGHDTEKCAMASQTSRLAGSQKKASAISKANRLSTRSGIFAKKHRVDEFCGC